jgi:DNA-binding CsgD family transcriptional regulator
LACVSRQCQDRRYGRQIDFHIQKPGTDAPKPTIVIVEHDAAVGEFLSLVLRRKGRGRTCRRGSISRDGKPTKSTSSCAILGMPKGRSMSGLLAHVDSADRAEQILIVCGQHVPRTAAGMLSDGATEMLTERLAQRPTSANLNLTPREREVLGWAAQGMSAAQTADILHIAKRTVDEHVQTAVRKLGALNRTHAVAIALREGIIEV